MATLEFKLSDLPPHNESSEERVVFARFPDSEFRRLRRIAGSRGQSLSELIRDCVVFTLPNGSNSKAN